MVAHPVERNFIDKAVVVHEGDDAGISNSVGGPADCLYIGIGQLTQQRSARGFAIRGRNASIELRVLAVFIVVVLVELTGIVRWITDTDENRRFTLALDPLG